MEANNINYMNFINSIHSKTYFPCIPRENCPPLIKKKKFPNTTAMPRKTDEENHHNKRIITTTTSYSLPANCR